MLSRRALALVPALLLLFTTAAPARQSPTAAPASSQAAATEDGLARARRLLEQRNLDEAVAELEAAQARGVPGAGRLLGVAHYRKGQHAQAAPLLKQAVDANPEDKEALQLLGLSYFFLARPQDAIPLLERTQEWFPVANVDAAYVLGICYIQVKDYENARRAFAQMFALPTNSAASHLLLARMLLRQGFDPVAEEHARRAVELDPELPGANFLLGEIYMFKSRLPEAIQAFERELALNPADAAVYYKLADAHSQALNWEEAQRLLQRSIWLDSTASGPFVLMGKVLLRKGETELAVGMLQRAVKMDPSNFIGHHLLGQAYRAQGRTEEASRQFRLAEQLQSAENPRP